MRSTGLLQFVVFLKLFFELSILVRSDNAAVSLHYAGTDDATMCYGTLDIIYPEEPSPGKPSPGKPSPGNSSPVKPEELTLKKVLNIEMSLQPIDGVSKRPGWFDRFRKRRGNFMLACKVWYEGEFSKKPGIKLITKGFKLLYTIHGLVPVTTLDEYYLQSPLQENDSRDLKAYKVIDALQLVAEGRTTYDVPVNSLPARSFYEKSKWVAEIILKRKSTPIFHCYTTETLDPETRILDTVKNIGKHHAKCNFEEYVRPHGGDKRGISIIWTNADIGVMSEIIKPEDKENLSAIIVFHQTHRSWTMTCVLGSSEEDIDSSTRYDIVTCRK